MCTGKYIECSTVKESRPKRKVTRRQDEVLRLHRLLTPITDGQKEWMFDEPFDKNRVAYYWKRGRVWCQECGHIEPKAALASELIINVGAQKYVCPHCGRTLDLQPYDYSMRHEVWVEKYCTVCTTFRGYQVFRTYEAVRHNKEGEPTERTVHPIYENWLHPDGKETVIASQYTRSLWNVRWQYGSEWSPKKHTQSWYASDLFDIEHNYWYPVRRYSPILRRNGYDDRMFPAGHVIRCMTALLTMPVAEELVKTGQRVLFAYMVARGWNEWQHFIHAVRICNRNGYVVKNPAMWMDYLYLLEYFHLDTHNAHYVCPADLQAEHDRLVKRKQRIEEREELARRIREAAKREKGYKKSHGRFFGIVFSGGGITVHVVSSVREMAEEGTVMHHCVYVNEYYRKKSSLILSARDEDGNRLETVEVDTSTWRVLQSRGICNQPTERHDDIVRLVEKNMKLLKKVA